MNDRTPVPPADRPGPIDGPPNGPPNGPIDWDDRLVDRALRELHGDRPPDLAADVLQRLTDDHNSIGARGGAHPSPRALLAAAALLVATALGWLLAGATAPLQQVAAAQIEVQVRRGEFAFARTPVPLRPQEPRVVLLRRGDRIDTDGTRASEAFVGPFGLVHTEPGTSLEVLDMDVRTKNGWIAAGSLTLAVITGAASWHWITERGTAEAGEVLRLETPGADAAGGGQLAAAAATAERLQDENAALRRRIEELELEAQRRPAPAVAAVTESGEEEPVDATPAAMGPAFDDARFADLLRAIDWKTMGEAAAKMGIPLVELLQRLEAGEELPMELAVQIAKDNMDLVAQLPKILEAGLPGTGPNGAWTHPLIVGNQLASLLQVSGLALDDHQRAAVAALVQQYAAENDGIHAVPTEMDLDRLIAEVGMKDRMYEALAAQLSPEQLAVVYPEGAGAFDGSSLFRSGLIWQSMAAPVRVPGPTGYGAAAMSRLTSQLNLDDATAARIRAIVEHTASTAPPEVWTAASPAERSKAGQFLRAGRAMRAAQLQQAWMRRVLHEVPLSDEQRNQLRSMQRVIVPLPR